MKELKTKTPSGKEITLNETGESYKSRINATDKYMYTVVKQDGINYVIAKDCEEEVQNFYREIAIEKAEAKKSELNTRIPGCTELQNAYEYRAEQIEISQEYMERGHRTSIFSGNKGKVEEAEVKVKELQEKYPIAKQYIKWNNGNSASSSGFAAKQAAEALYAGKNLEEAAKIANDWNHFD